MSRVSRGVHAQLPPPTRLGRRRRQGQRRVGRAGREQQEDIQQVVAAGVQVLLLQRARGLLQPLPARRVRPQCIVGESAECGFSEQKSACSDSSAHDRAHLRKWPATTPLIACNIAPPSVPRECPIRHVAIIYLSLATFLVSHHLSPVAPFSFL